MSDLGRRFPTMSLFLLAPLVVCGSSVDPHVCEEARRHGDLQVLARRMNPDLSMGADLLKKTCSGNLFMVFGEPVVTPRLTCEEIPKPQKVARAFRSAGAQADRESRRGLRRRLPPND